MTVKPIPDGYKAVTPHLTINNAADAIEFYKNAFGAKELSRMEGPGGKIMHAAIQVGDCVVMLNDEFPDMGACSPLALGGSPITLHLYVENVDEFYDQAIGAGAKALFPVNDTFWGDRYGKLEDPYGHKWSIATHIEDLTDEEICKRGKEFFSKHSGD
ncbi:MAG: VOC family protein [bacterium]|nr:VOC family protein [bacterium]